MAACLFAQVIDGGATPSSSPAALPRTPAAVPFDSYVQRAVGRRDTITTVRCRGNYRNTFTSECPVFYPGLRPNMTRQEKIKTHIPVADETIGLPLDATRRG